MPALVVASDDPLGNLTSKSIKDKVLTWGSKSNPIVEKNDNYQDIVMVTLDGAWREEIEIELRDEKDESFGGSEAKYDIYRDCIGFRDFKNFDGVRFSFKGIRLVTFKLKEHQFTLTNSK